MRAALARRHPSRGGARETRGHGAVGDGAARTKHPPPPGSDIQPISVRQLTRGRVTAGSMFSAPSLREAPACRLGASQIPCCEGDWIGGNRYSTPLRGPEVRGTPSRYLLLVSQRVD